MSLDSGRNGSREELKARRRDAITTASDVGGLSNGDSDVTDRRLLVVSYELSLSHVEMVTAAMSLLILAAGIIGFPGHHRHPPC